MRHLSSGSCSRRILKHVCSNFLDVSDASNILDSLVGNLCSTFAWLSQTIQSHSRRGVYSKIVDCFVDAIRLLRLQVARLIFCVKALRLSDSLYDELSTVDLYEQKISLLEWKNRIVSELSWKIDPGGSIDSVAGSRLLFGHGKPGEYLLDQDRPCRTPVS